MVLWNQSIMITKANLTILTDLYHIKYVFYSYYEADINLTQVYVCSQLSKLFALKTFFQELFAL